MPRLPILSLHLREDCNLDREWMCIQESLSVRLVFLARAVVMARSLNNGTLGSASPLPYAILPYNTPTPCSTLRSLPGVPRHTPGPPTLPPYKPATIQLGGKTDASIFGRGIRPPLRMLHDLINGGTPAIQRIRCGVQDVPALSWDNPRWRCQRSLPS